MASFKQHPVRCEIYLAIGDLLISRNQDNEERGGPFNVGDVFHMIPGHSFFRTSSSGVLDIIRDTAAWAVWGVLRIWIS